MSEQKPPFFEAGREDGLQGNPPRMLIKGYLEGYKEGRVEYLKEKRILDDIFGPCRCN